MRSPSSTIDTSVKFVTYAMGGFPTGVSNPGSRIAILDAFLVNGGQELNATSCAVSAGIMTINFSSVDSFFVEGCVVRVSGATPSDLNGDHRVTSVNSTSISFPVNIADATVSGSVQVKVAPLDWEIVFSDGNKRVYSYTDPQGYGAFIRIDDSSDTECLVSAYSEMSDIDSGIDRMPESGDMHWTFSYYASETNTRWMFVGDSRAFYPLVSPYSSMGGLMYTGLGFGDFVSHNSGNRWDVFLSGFTSTQQNSNSGSIFHGITETGTVKIMKKYTGVGSSVDGNFLPESGSSDGVSGDDSYQGVYPNPADNSMRLYRNLIIETPKASNGPRGYIPGVLYCPQTGLFVDQFPGGKVIHGTGEFSGRFLLCVPCSSPASGAGTPGVGFIDLSQPWR